MSVVVKTAAFGVDLFLGGLPPYTATVRWFLWHFGGFYKAFASFGQLSLMW